MTFADLIVIGIIAVSVLFSFFFGFVWEVLFFASWVGAALAAYFGFPHVSRRSATVWAPISSRRSPSSSPPLSC